MWSRVELKEKAKKRIHANYWKCVLIALILTALTGSFTGSSSPNVNNVIQNAEDQGQNIISDLPDELSDLDSISDFPSTLEHAGMNFAIISMIVGFVIFLVSIIVIPLQVFLLNPLIVGCRRFFMKNSTMDSQAKELGYCFDTKYLSSVKTMFLKDLFTFLWTLLLIIPGIIKSYEYRMIPYILADHSDITTEDAFALSKKMMDGNKMNAFILDLSFIGWHILNAITFGILGIFYLMPYIYQTDAELYHALKQPEQVDVFHDFEVE